MRRRKHPMVSWLDRTVRNLCDRPDHLQRLSIVGAGMSVYPAVFALIGLLVWFALRHPDAPGQIISGLINFVYCFLALFALVVISLLGTIKGFRIGPSGMEVTTTADDPDVDPSTTRDTRLSSAAPGYASSVPDGSPGAPDAAGGDKPDDTQVTE